MRIDAHHHFWQYDPVEYDWIGDAMRAIRRDFLPADLRREIGQVGIDGVVSVQARQTLEETEWLLRLARENDFIRGVVGWVPLVDPAVRGHLERLAANPMLKAVRHGLQGEADDRYMLRDDFNAGIRAVHACGLAYDILIFERHLPHAIEFVDRHADQVFVVDHIAKPRLRDNALEPWRGHILELAKRPHVFCKMSGLVTEADYAAWTEAQLQPYLETVLEAFGPQRLMFGSDWPVCLVACDYGRWHEIVNRFAARLSPDEQASLFGGTATRAYRLDG